MALLIARLQAQRTPFAFFNQRDFATADLRWTLENGHLNGQLQLDQRIYQLSWFTGIYLRLMDHTALPELAQEPPASPLRAHCHDLHNSLIRWTDIASARVVNRFRCMGSNGSKPYQAQLIRRAAFSVPRTLITNDPECVREFAAQYGPLIYKSISGVRSIVTTMTDEDWERIDHIRSCPVQFQERVEGFDARVHTVGNQVFATRIDSVDTDYRYAHQHGHETHLSAYELSEDIAATCLRLADLLGLPFAGIDLRITPDGNIYCFEVNPSPAYSYYESHTGQPISQALADYLAGKTD